MPLGAVAFAPGSDGVVSGGADGNADLGLGGRQMPPLRSASMCTRAFVPSRHSTSKVLPETRRTLCTWSKSAKADWVNRTSARKTKERSMIKTLAGLVLSATTATQKKRRSTKRSPSIRVDSHQCVFAASGRTTWLARNSSSTRRDSAKKVAN